jgi:hypothetical protein
MKFDTIQHTFDGGIDRHVDGRYRCVLDAEASHGPLPRRE